MAYLALKVFPSDNSQTNSFSDPAARVAQKAELITIGNYRFEATSNRSKQAKVIELRPNQSDRNTRIQ